jgi:hypothetical protein
LKYRILNGDVSPPPPYVGGPYVKVVSIDSPYPLPIGPLNIAQNRLYDTLTDLCDILNTDYVPYEWYIAYDDDNTFHLTTRRGSDKSDSIIFEKGVNLRGTSFESSTEYTTQRVKVIGRGEGKRQDDVSSTWVNDEAAMNTVGGFIEDIVTKKSVANEEIADTLAHVHLKMNALPKNTILVDVSKDTYDSMEYDVGDDAKIIDALTELNEAKRIYNIKKDIDSGGEHIKLYVDYPYKDVEEVWGDIYKKLKDLSLVGTIAADWSGQGTKEGNVGADQLSPLFDITAKNDEVTVGNDKADPKWAKDEHGGNWQANNDNMVIYGPEFGYGYIRVECRYKVVKNVPRGGTIKDVSDAIDIPIYKTPKFVCEFKIDEPSGINYTSWREGDDVDFGMFNMDTKLGFLFRVIKSSGFFTVYAVSYTEKGQIARKITSIKENVKYRAEIITDGDNNSVTLNLWDIEENPNAKYPVSAVFLNVNQSMTVRPLYAAAYADGDLEISLWCVMFLYEMKCEYNRAG